MQLAWIDWAIVASFLGVSLAVGIVVSRRAGQDSNAFFLSGRNMPWWLLGVSMVATTFSTDTPNLVTEIVRTQGVSGNWIWWAFLITGMFTCFLYARLWRRSGVMTDLEFYEIRYSGKAAAGLRAFRAIYLGVFFNIMVMALVTVAAIKIGAVMLGLTPVQTVMIAGSVTVIFSALGGFVGVVITDMILFVISMIGAISAAFIAVTLPEVGGLGPLLAHPEVAPKLSFFPDFSDTEMVTAVLVIPLAIQWWSVWYPGSEPGGGGYVAQRMLAAKSERDAVGAMLLFQAAHYALRPWPWILVALASIVVFPTLDSIKQTFPHVDPSVINHDLAYPAMLTFLPTGLLGLVLASLISAYMSTISTQLNWGASYVVNDFYRRFINPGATERRLVGVGRVATVGLMILASGFALLLESALQAFNILLTVGAGTGLLFLLRWYWWRINALSEVAAMVVSFGAALFFQFAELPDWSAAEKLIGGIAVTTAAWVFVALVGPQTDMKTLKAFYSLTRPQGPGWRHVSSKMGRSGEESGTGELASGLLNIFLGCVTVYSTLFGFGNLVYGNVLPALLLLILAATSGFTVVRSALRTR